jgi:hypothetical protein
MKVTNPPYTDQELFSNIEAYSMRPWGERLAEKEVEEYLKSFRSDKRGLVYTYRETVDAPTYLYVHTMHYGRDVEELMEDDFTGEHSFYQAVNGAAISDKFHNAGDIAYISNITADKSVDIPDEFKPRLKVMPDIIASVFTDTGAQTIVMYTHRTTAVYRTALELPKQDYDVEVFSYEIVPKEGGFNENRDIDHLEVILVRKR